MKATLTHFGPPKAAQGRPVLCPELSAAVAARHSRCDEGLDRILEIVEGYADQDVAVDRIFNMIDYGHRSVADLVPISVHIEGVSIWLVEMIWGLVHTGGGQETSTRYCKLKPEEMLKMDFHNEGDRNEWDSILKSAVVTYNAACAYWGEVGRAMPQLAGVTPDMDEKKAERFRRNFIFDRARYAIPSVALTNMNITTWGTEWIRIISMLKSSPWIEAHQVADLVLVEVAIAAPRLIRHAGLTKAGQAWWQQRLDVSDTVLGSRKAGLYPSLSRDQDMAKIIEDIKYREVVAEEFTTFEAGGLADVDEDLIIESMEHRTNRYDPIGLGLAEVPVRYGWDLVANAEIRDMNRHRPGVRKIGLAPCGFYYAGEKIIGSLIEEGCGFDGHGEKARELMFQFDRLSARMLNFSTRVVCGESSALAHDFPYFSALGTQYTFQHTSTLGHLIYECELRTGPGTHFRYRAHYQNLIKKMVAALPGLDKYLLIGSGEPE
jgi:thymidylate synthase ThyX